MSLPYKEIGVAEWTDCQRAQADSRITVSGTCSRCGHRTAFTFETVYAAGASTESRTESHNSDSVVIECGCAEVHEGRTASDSGCGAFFYASAADG